MKYMKDKKRFKTKIRVGSVMKAKVGDVEDKTRHGRTRRTRKEVVGCIQCGGNFLELCGG